MRSLYVCGLRRIQTRMNAELNECGVEMNAELK